MTSVTHMQGYPCAVCRRASGGFTIQEPGRVAQFCSHNCMRVYAMLGPDLAQDETKAAVVGGNAGGEYLDRIGKTDLAALTEVEWQTFCGKIFHGACDELKRQADDRIPF
jgi:hypothetical protein